jgi:hypothetical protein
MYVTHTLEMRESVAWRALPDISRRFLDRLEVEHLRHKLRDNKRLICTYKNLEEWGLRRSSIRLGIEIAVALGFVEITRRGFKSVPSTYFLTYVVNYPPDEIPATNEWRRFKAPHEASDAIRTVKAALKHAKDMKKSRRLGINILPGRKSKLRAPISVVNPSDRSRMRN